jgi:hypothetical protein
MYSIPIIGLGFQLMVGALFVCAAISGLAKQMKRRNDLIEAELRAKGVPLMTPESE